MGQSSKQWKPCTVCKKRLTKNPICFKCTIKGKEMPQSYRNHNWTMGGY